MDGIRKMSAAASMQVREFLAVAAVEHGAAREALLQAVQELLVVVLAAAEHHEPDVPRSSTSGSTS